MAALRSTYKVYHALGRARKRSCDVLLEWAGPGVGGSIIFPLSVSVGLALELLLSDVFVSVGTLLLNVNGLGGNGEGG